jgi:hypothetical protein
VNDRPIRLVLNDDRRRSRLTVAFRIFLAIPHLLWFVLFSIGAFFVVVAAWFSALVRGAVPGALHGFLASYLRYATHLYAYLSLTANPYPGFLGDLGYPVDLAIAGPRPQSRLAVAFRLVLALPVFLLAAVLTAAPNAGGGWDRDGQGEFDWQTGAGGVLWTVAFLAWFACLARGRMPLGFRNLNAYALRFAAETWGYALLLTDRYPNADPRLPRGAGFMADRPVHVTVEEDLSRSRLTVFFRLFLALPHLVWLMLWSALAVLVGIVNWLVTLVLGRSPNALHRFLAAYVRYAAHVGAYLFLVTNPFAGFTGGPYPLAVEIAPPERQNRWKTAFRGLLVIPAGLVSGGLTGVLFVVGFLGWFYALVTGRMAHGLREAGVYALRYSAETSAYFWLLTPRYPFSGPPIETAPPVAVDAAA